MIKIVAVGVVKATVRQLYVACRYSNGGNTISAKIVSVVVVVNVTQHCNTIFSKLLLL